MKLTNDFYNKYFHILYGLIISESTIKTSSKFFNRSGDMIYYNGNDIKMDFKNFEYITRETIKFLTELCYLKVIPKDYYAVMNMNFDKCAKIYQNKGYKANHFAEWKPYFNQQNEHKDLLYHEEISHLDTALPYIKNCCEKDKLPQLQTVVTILKQGKDNGSKFKRVIELIKSYCCDY